MILIFGSPHVMISYDLNGGRSMKDQDEFLSDINIGRRLAELRHDRGLSQLAAAKALGVTQSCISQLECGKRRLSISAAQKLSSLYQVDISCILGGSPVSAEPPEVKPSEGELLLNELVSSADSANLTFSVNSYMALSIYRVLRTVYSLNPHNSDELFSVPEEEAMKLTEQFLRDEPYRIITLGLAGNLLSRKKIELPTELAPRLRAFIKECEALLSGNDE